MTSEIFKVLFSVWLYPFISFTLCTIVLINEVIRGILSLVLWLQYRGNIVLVSDGSDAAWEYQTPGNTRMVIVCLITRRGQLDSARKCAKTLQDRVFQTGNYKNDKAYEKLQNAITRRYGYICWRRDPNFNSRRHIRSMDRDFEYTEKDVKNLLSQLTNDMDEMKPQWEWVFIPKFVDSNGNKKALQIFRFHHAYMDGMSGLILISRLSDNFKFLLDPLTFKTPLWKRIYTYINCFLFGPITLFRMYRNKYLNYWNRRRNRSRYSGKKFLTWSNENIPFDVLKTIRFETKASISTIVSFAFMEACKAVLPKKRLVKEIRISEVVAFFPYPNSNPQNRFTAYTYGIDLENSESVFQRLKTAQKNSIGGIGGPEPLVIYYVAKLAGRFSYHILPYIFSGANSSLHLSNIPCAKDRFRFFNTDCEEFIAFPPLPNDTGLCISSISYKDGFKICGQADSSCLSESELRQIFKRIPQIIYTIAGCSPPPVIVVSQSNSGFASDASTSAANRNSANLSDTPAEALQRYNLEAKIARSKSPNRRKKHRKRTGNMIFY